MNVRIFTSLLILWLSGCTFTGKSPPSHFYIIPAPRGVQPVSHKAQIIALAPIKMPKYLERPQIVTMKENGKILLAEFHRWAEPLAAGFIRVLGAGLGARLPQSHIVTLPASRIHPDWVLELRVHELQVHQDHCYLQADWRLMRGNRTYAWHRTAVRQPLPGRDYATIVATLGLTIGRLAGEVAETLAQAD